MGQEAGDGRHMALGVFQIYLKIGEIIVALCGLQTRPCDIEPHNIETIGNQEVNIFTRER